jgi:S1-C subfamily serine protease
LEVSVGTGFFVDPHGTIATACHVVDGAESILVRVGDKWVEAKVSKADRVNDVAILGVSAESPSYIPLNSHPFVMLGDRVFTVGFPFTELLGEAPKYSEGSVGSLSGIDSDPTSMQLDIAVQPGNSGGPLVSVTGRLLGVVVAKLSALKTLKATGTLPEGVAFAVKVDYLAALAPELLGAGNPEQVDVQRVQLSVCLIKATMAAK